MTVLVSCNNVSRDRTSGRVEGSTAYASCKCLERRTERPICPACAMHAWWEPMEPWRSSLRGPLVVPASPASRCACRGVPHQSSRAAWLAQSLVSALCTMQPPSTYIIRPSRRFSYLLEHILYSQQRLPRHTSAPLSNVPPPHSLFCSKPRPHLSSIVSAVLLQLAHNGCA